MFLCNPGHAPRVVRAVMLCIGIAMAFPPKALAAPAGLSLQEAVRVAVERAPLLDARRAQVDAARQEARRAGALPDPMLTVGIDNLPVTGGDAFDTRADEMTMKKIGLRQELPGRAKREASRALAARRSEAAAAEVTVGRHAVQQATAQAWIALWGAQRELASLQALREQAALASRLARARVAGGSEPATDALAAQAAVLELDTRMEGARAGLQAARAELARWIGDEVDAVADVPPDFSTLPIPEARLLASADRTIPMLPATAQVETAAAEIDAARAERHPDWSIAASYGQRSDGRSDMVMLEFGIGLPLFPRNRQDRGIAAREADYQAALDMRDDLRRQQVARIRADLARWQGLKRQVALHEESLLPLAHDRSTVALAAYRAGGSLRPWLEARRDELDVHLAHAEHLAGLGRAWAALAYLLPTQEVQP